MQLCLSALILYIRFALFFHKGWEEVFIMAYGGIRGAVGFSLVVTLPVTIVHRYKKTRVPHTFNYLFNQYTCSPFYSIFRSPKTISLNKPIKRQNIVVLLSYIEQVSLYRGHVDSRAVHRFYPRFVRTDGLIMVVTKKKLTETEKNGDTQQA